MIYDLKTEYARLHSGLLPDANAQAAHIQSREVYEPPELTVETQREYEGRVILGIARAIAICALGYVVYACVSSALFWWLA